MNTRSDILRAHYLRFARKISVWAGVASIVAGLFVPAGASAVGQLTVRSATLGTSTAGATTNISFSFKPANTATIKAITFQLCSSPLDLGLGTCTAVASSTMASAAFTTAGQSAPFNASWALGTGSDCGADTSTRACIFFTTGSSLTSGTQYTVNITGITIPNTANTQFYTRIATWTGAAAGTPSGETDFGGEALSTGTTMSESATVQESLVFALGTSGTTCANVAGGGTVSMTNSAPMSTATDTYGTGKMCANTNASGGYVITYTGTAFAASGGSTFTAPVSLFTATAGTPNFGFNLKADTMPVGSVASGADPSGGGGRCTPYTNYCTANQYSYSTAGGIAVADSNSAPSADTIYTMNYVAEIDNTIKSGVYTATQVFIATGTF